MRTKPRMSVRHTIHDCRLCPHGIQVDKWPQGTHASCFSFLWHSVQSTEGCTVPKRKIVALIREHIHQDYLKVYLSRDLLPVF